MSRSNVKAPWFKYFPDDFEKAFKGMTLSEIGFTQLIINSMWSGPGKSRLEWDSGTPVKKRELPAYFSMEKRSVEKMIEKILRKTSMISLNENGDFVSQYLQDQIDSWKSKGRGDR